MKILITGGINSGKSLLAAQLANETGYQLWHTDTLLTGSDPDKIEWAPVNKEVAGWFERPAPWIVCGVRVPYAVQGWLKEHEPPVADWAFVLTTALSPVTAKQRQFSNQLLAVWRNVEWRAAPVVRWRRYDPRLIEEFKHDRQAVHS